MKERNLSITNARENNLKSISLDIPHDTLTVVTGLSGSGKSSLAFDTVYAEGQRRYIETFSPYTRQFFDKVKKPEVDLIENVRPAIAIQQRTRITNSRSTVGSMTNVNDYLKILWTAVAEPFCPACNISLKKWESGELASHLIALHELKGRPSLLVAAPYPIKDRKKLKVEFERLTTLGYTRFFNPVDGSIESPEDGALPRLTKRNELLIVLDRLKGDALNKKRLKESIDQSFTLSHCEGRESVCYVIDPTPEAKKSEHKKSYLTVLNTPQQENVESVPYSIMEFKHTLSCSYAGFTIEEARPSLFSFNHPLGACQTCKGFGKILKIDPALCIPNPTLSLAEKAIVCWATENTATEYKELMRFCKKEDIPTNVSWGELREVEKEKVLTDKTKDYWGVYPWFQWLETKTYKMHIRVFLSKYRGQYDCPECKGTRLRAGALTYRVCGKTLPELWNMPISELLKFFKELQVELKERKKLSRELNELFSAVISRINYLNELGLPYLTLERQARTLSGGETQRVNLAAALGSELISTHFVLDEPSVGLHARDTARLIKAMRALHQRGNSLLVVEHDLDCIAEADNIIELGPEAGENGGQIIYSGPTAQWKGIEVDTALSNRDVKKGADLIIKNATARNLKGFTLKIPLGNFISLTGVSGSGKSTLVHEVLERAFDRFTMGVKDTSNENVVTGFQALSQVLIVDQAPLAKSPRGNIGTYSGIWNTIRDLLASTDDAIARALSKSAFSFNVDGGRCPECKGAGFIREDMQFLSDVFIPCEVCLGKRFQDSVLEVQYKGHNADKLLKMSVERCSTFFHANQSIARIAETLCELGLGHLTLGHPLSELSGGEAQRLKLVPFLEKTSSSTNTLPSLLIFDEPTIGLHHLDVLKLIGLLKNLTEKGHTVLCVEHNLSLIAASDYVIDIGPEGGEDGGFIVKEGTPESIAHDKDTKLRSETGIYLKRFHEQTSSRLIKPAKSGIAEDKSVLRIRGAREHNLKNIDIEIPLDRMVALCGVSGSGKSTIAKDIIYAEGQRRYLDCLSPYARQFIKELKKPEIDEIKNVKPTICVYQHTFQPSKLSTLGTMSEIYNYLRLLYSKTGTQYCPEHPKEAISPLSAEDIAKEIKNIKSASIRILAPVIKKKKGNHREVLERAVSAEITQVRVDGVFLSTGSVSMSGGLERSKAHTIEFVMGKFNPSQVPIDIISEAVTQGLSLGSGTLVVVTENKETVFSTERTCSICKRGFFKPDPEDLSFSSRRGACKTCGGSGVGSRCAPCSECSGARINEVGRNLRIGELNIFELSLLRPPEMKTYLQKILFQNRHEKVAAPILSELYSRADMLTEVGLDYLSLHRECATLSGGELQRLRLAAAMGSPLSGVMYIFDEPSAGLHPDDNEKVLARLSDLKAKGNSVILIEHDPASILTADYVIDIGPGGGQRGGNVVFAGSRDEFLESDTSPTAEAIRNEDSVESRTFSPVGNLSIRNGTKNNIQKLSTELPLGGVIAVAGVSGAGKSSLVRGIIGETLTEGKGELNNWTVSGCTIRSSVDIQRVLEVDQKPIGINSRSTPASYLGVWDEIRVLFSRTLEAKSRGWTNSFFSYNSGKGRCAECKGLGQIKLEMSFLPDAFIQCETCRGTRFTEEAKSVRYLGLSINEVLNLTFEEAMTTFVNHRKVYQPLRQAFDLGLGYLTLGQSSSTLSGGESQRIKLVSELSGSRKGHTLYILDEPTTGLHKADVGRLIKTLRSLVSLSSTVVLIEHDEDMIRNSDYIVEMGPGPGSDGGRILFQGTPNALQGKNTPWGRILGEKARRRALREGDVKKHLSGAAEYAGPMSSL